MFLQQQATTTTTTAAIATNALKIISVKHGPQFAYQTEC